MATRLVPIGPKASVSQFKNKSVRDNAVDESESWIQSCQLLFNSSGKLIQPGLQEYPLPSNHHRIYSISLSAIHVHTLGTLVDNSLLQLEFNIKHPGHNDHGSAHRDTILVGSNFSTGGQQFEQPVVLAVDPMGAIDFGENPTVGLKDPIVTIGGTGALGDRVTFTAIALMLNVEYRRATSTRRSDFVN